VRSGKRSEERGARRTGEKEPGVRREDGAKSGDEGDYSEKGRSQE
jgi:hypothetical protein